MRFGVSILLSLLAHGLLAAALAVYVGLAPAPAELARLDLSSVDLSFAEEEDDSAAVQPTMASAPSDPVPETKPPEPERPPEMEAFKELPPDLDAMKLPEPDEERPEMETPEIPETREENAVEEEPETPPAPASPASAAVVQAAPQQARVDAPPSPRKAIKPKYPKGARQRGEQGDVVMEIDVTAEGRVGGFRIVSSSGFPELDEEAVKAVRAARFVPAKRDRRAVASTARITLTFRLK